MNTRSQVLRNTLFSSVGIYTEYFIGMLTSILIARHMGPGDYGVYGLVIWMSGLGVALVNAGIASAMIKFVAELRGTGSDQLIGPLVRRLRRIQRFVMLGVIAGGALLFLQLGPRIAPELDHFGFALLLLSVALRAPYMLNIALAKGYENFRATAVIAAIAAPVNLLMVVVAFLLDAPMEGYIVVYALSGLVFFLISSWQVRGLVPARRDGVVLPAALLVRLRSYLLLVVVNVLVAFFSSSEIEVLFLNLWATSAEAGQFKVAYQLASSAALLIPGVFGAIMLPMMARSLRESAEKARDRFILFTCYLFMLAAPLAAFGAALATDVVTVLYGQAYRPAGIALAWCLAACVLASASAGASSLLLSADRQGSVVKISIVSGIAKLAFGSLLTLHFGLAGAIAGFVLVLCITTFSQFGLAIRVSAARMPWSRLARIALAAALAFVPAFVAARGLSPWVALCAGGAALLLTYVLACLVLGCWSRQDLAYLRDGLQKIGNGRLQLFDRVLAWAQLRAA